MDYTKHLKQQKIDEGVADTGGHLGQYMYTIIARNQNKMKFGKWECDANRMMGTIEWNHPTLPYQVFLTPFWEGAEGVSVDVSNFETDEYRGGKVLPLVITGNEKKDISAYMKAVAPVFKLFKGK